MNPKFKRITTDPEIVNGQPCIRGMRITVRRVVEAVALYPDRAELKAEYQARQGLQRSRLRFMHPSESTEKNPKYYGRHDKSRPAYSCLLASKLGSGC